MISHMVSDFMLLIFPFNYRTDYPIREDTLIPIPGSRKPFNRVGRGISAGQGASCGRGTRGTQKSRGHGVRPGFEGGQTPLHLRLPKYRKMKGHRKKKYNLIHMAMLNALPGDMDVCYETLFDLGLCTKVKRKNRIFKVLGGENCTAANLTVKAHAFTRTAKQAIEAVGGQCVVLSKTRHIPEHIALKEKKERIAANLVKLKALRQLKLRTKREKQAALEASPDYVPPKPKVKKKPKPKAKKKKKKAPAKVITSKNKKKEDKGGKKKKKK